ncbi:MAG TPA: hypothetical protein PLW71_03635, partial [Candidatus Syntrophosphaera thermopropionivorans]|nr:hypothetical protein [Candidatus Syntrophosphaera thermopropionivorans]
YTLPQNAKYFAVQCVSNDAFIFMVDDFLVTDQSLPPVLTAPENVAIETFPGGISLGWDLVSGANSYKVYGSNDPYGTYIFLQSVEDNHITFTDQALNALGLSNRAFFKITADTAILATKTTSQERKNSSPLLQNYLLNQNKTLNVMNSKVKP